MDPDKLFSFEVVMVLKCLVILAGELIFPWDIGYFVKQGQTLGGNSPN